MKKYTVTIAAEQKVVMARNPQAAVNKAFRPGYSFRWTEGEGNFLGAHPAMVDDGLEAFMFRIHELG